MWNIFVYLPDLDHLPIWIGSGSTQLDLLDGVLLILYDSSQFLDLLIEIKDEVLVEGLVFFSNLGRQQNLVYMYKSLPYFELRYVPRSFSIIIAPGADSHHVASRRFC